MNSIRRLFLAAATLLVLSACSQPNDIQAPTLEPQFAESSTGAASVNAMSANVNGVYLGGSWGNRPALINFTRSGRIPWVRTLPGSAKVKGVTAGLDGEVYLVYAVNESGGTRSFFVRKYSQTGAALWTQQLATGVKESDTDTSTLASTDGKGNVYLATTFGYGASARVELRKYWAKGTLAWQQDVGSYDDYIGDLDVSDDGLIHTVSGSGDYRALSRYRSDGRLLWRVPVPYSNDVQKVAVGEESNIYVASNSEVLPAQFFTTLIRYDTHGKKLWQKAVQDAIGLRLEGLDADAQGNAFLGLTNNYGGDVDERLKEFYTYSSNGKKLVHKSFDFGTEQPLVGPVALTPTEVYLATSGVGEDGQAGLLLRLNGLTGSVTWKR